MTQPTSTVETTARPNRLIRWAAGVLLFYGAIEIIDCLTVIAMQAKLVDNIYPTFAFGAVQRLMDSQPLWFLPPFLFFTILHLWSGAGLWRNRLWGWWMALFATGAVVVFVPFLLPMSGGDMLAAIVIIGLLLIGRFGQRSVSGGAA